MLLASVMIHLSGMIEERSSNNGRSKRIEYVVEHSTKLDVTFSDAISSQFTPLKYLVIQVSNSNSHEIPPHSSQMKLCLFCGTISSSHPL